MHNFLKKFKALFGAQDMTVGSPFSCLIKFAVPLLIGNFAQLLYTTADAVVVGNVLGDEALAALGASMAPYNIFLVLLIGVGSGVTVMVSQYFGAKEYDNLALSIGNSITIVAFISIIITAVVTPLTGSILRLVDTPVEMFEMGHAYLTILFLGAAGFGFYNVLSGILRGLGEAMFPLLVLVAAVILNIALDIWFVAGLEMGVEGAAIATVISQVLAATVCLIKILKMRDVVKIHGHMIRLNRRISSQIIKLGGPTAISHAIMFAAMFTVQALINKMGVSVVAAMTATFRLDAFAIIPIQTFQIVGGTFTGQNIGAGKMDRVRQGTKTVLLMCFVFTGIVIVGMLLFGRNMLGLFTKSDDIIEMSITFVRILVPVYLFFSISGNLMGIMRGAGDAIGPMWIMMLNNLVLRVPLAYLMVHLSRTDSLPNGDPNVIWWATCLSMAIGCMITVTYYRLGHWRKKAIVGT